MWLLRKAADLVFGIVALVLCGALILVLSVLPIAMVGPAVLDSEVIQDVLTTVVTPEIFGEGEDSMIQTVLGTETAQDVLDLYLDDMFHQLEGGESQLDLWSVMSVVEDHMDELIPMYQQWAGSFLGGDLPISEDAQKLAVYAATQEYGDMILDHLPSMEELGLKAIPQVDLSWLPNGELLSLWILDSDMLAGFRNFSFSQEDLMALANQALILFKDGLAFRIGLHLALALSLLILVLRLGKGFRCTFWVGMSYLLAGSLAASTTACLKFGLKALTAGSDYESLFQALKSVIDQPMNCSLVILAVGAVLVVASKIGDRILERKKKQ